MSTSEAVVLSRAAKIHPTAIVEQGATLAAGVEIGPYCIVSGAATLGENVRLISHVQIMGRTSVGAGCEVHPFAVLGGPPQIANYVDGDTSLEIGPNCVIREHTTMHRGSPKGRAKTVVGSGCLFMVGAHVAHDCIVGDNVIFANNATIGGHCIIEDHVFLGGLSAVHQNARVGKHAMIGGGSPIGGDVVPFGMVSVEGGTLNGLNVVGLRRRGFSRQQIHDIRAAFSYIFSGSEEGTRAERLEIAKTKFAHSKEAQELIEFITVDSNRALCLPRIR